MEVECVLNPYSSKNTLKKVCWTIIYVDVTRVLWIWLPIFDASFFLLFFFSIMTIFYQKTHLFFFFSIMTIVYQRQFSLSWVLLFLYKSIMVVSVVILRMEIIIMISYLLIVTINYFHAPNKGMQGVPGISGESWSPDLKGKRKRSRRGRTLNVFYASWEMPSYHKNSTQSHFKGLKL